MIPLGDDVRSVRLPTMTYLLLALTWGVWLLTRILAVAFIAGVVPKA